MMRRLARAAALGALLSLAASAAALLGACSMGGGIAAKRYAAVFGVSDYQNLSDLTYADDDAVSMTDLLSMQGYTTLASGTDAMATRAAILQAIADAAAACDDTDSLFFFYFSGHGARAESASGDEEYIAPYDASLVSVNSLISTAQLSEALSQIKCRNIVVVLDTCYSGGFVDDGSTIDAESGDYDGSSTSVLYSAITHFGSLLEANADELDATPPITISASGADEESIEGYGDHGVFTYFFLESVEEGDANGDGYITATEAYSYAVDGVERVYNRYTNVSDYLPRISGGARDLVLFED